jgi:hypothetical protein
VALDFIYISANTPYLFAFLLLMMIFLIEIIGIFVGMGLLGALDSAFDIDFDSDTGGLLTLLGLGKVPLIVWVALQLGIFVLLGYFFSSLAASLLGVSSIWLAVAVGFVSVWLSSLACTVLSKVVPRVESDVVSNKSFSGSVAVVVTGDASYTKFAMAVVRDIHNKPHNIKVKAFDEGVELLQGSNVVLVEMQNDYDLWSAIPHRD